MKALVIGCGNPLRGDDGVGWRLAEMIDRTGTPARVLTVHALVPELAPELAAAGIVLFLDARTGSNPGRVRHTIIEPAPQRAAPTHGLTPATLLHLTWSVYGYGPPAHLVTVETRAFGFGQSLSRPAQSACTEAVLEALEIIRGRAASAPPPLPVSR